MHSSSRAEDNLPIVNPSTKCTILSLLQRVYFCIYYGCFFFFKSSKAETDAHAANKINIQGERFEERLLQIFCSLPYASCVGRRRYCCRCHWKCIFLRECRHRTMFIF